MQQLNTVLNGIEQWVARYNGPGNFDDHASSITIDNNGNVFVTGWSAGSQSNYGYATIKYNSDGMEQWVKRYNNLQNGTDQAVAVIADDMGNIYVTGYSQGTGTNFDYATLKYNSDGNELWVKRYNYEILNSDDWAYAITLDNSGNVYVTGVSTGLSMADYLTIKYDSNGEEQWTQRYKWTPKSI